MRYRLLIVFCSAIVQVSPLLAAPYYWTTGGDGTSVFDETNWSLHADGTGGPLPAIDPGVAVNHDLIITNGIPGGTGAGEAGSLNLGTGSLLLSGGSLRLNTSSDVLNGPVTVSGGELHARYLSGSASTLNQSGGTLTLQALVARTVTFSGGSISVSGGNNPLNSTVIDFTHTNAILHCTNETPAAFRSEHLGKMRINGNPAVEGDNILLIDDGASGTIVRLLNPTVDSDNDDLADAWEMRWFQNLTTAGVGTDSDFDGVSDEAEETNDLNPTDPDTDHDGLADGAEAAFGTNPALNDSDGDSVPDGMELNEGLNPTNAVSTTSRPNIIYILVDDLGFGDVGVFWQDARTSTRKFNTPGLDRMAAEGVMMTHHYISAPVCAPSRASLLLGQHQGHCDVRNNSFDKVLINNHTIASTLRDAGYYTAHVGKYGLAGGEGGTNAGHPLLRGFDYFLGYLYHNDGHEHYPRNGTTDKVAVIWENQTRILDAHDDLYTTDVWTARAKQIVIDETENNPDRPFFIYLAYDTPHQKMQYPPMAYPAGSGKTGGLQWVGSPNYVNTSLNQAFDDYVHPDHASTGWPASNKKHAGMVRRMDQGVDDLLDTLVELGIADNTLVVFSSDNGPHHENHDPQFFQSYGGFEGTKRDMWEGGIREPTIAWWPNTIPATGSEAAPRRTTFPSGNWDWMPTLTAAAGLPAPAIVDGVDLLPDLRGQPGQRDNGFLYFEYSTSGSARTYNDFHFHAGASRTQQQAIRIGDYMGVRVNVANSNSDFQIYDVTGDLKQSTNLAGTTPFFKALQQQMKDTCVQSRRTHPSYSRPYDGAAMPSVIVTHPVEPGLLARRFEGYWPWVPEFRDLPEHSRLTSAGLDVGLRTRDDHVGLEFAGWLDVPTTGTYTFWFSSDARAHVRIHNAVLFDAGRPVPPGTEQSTSLDLEAGLHPIRVGWMRTAGAAHAIELDWDGPSTGGRVAVPNSAWKRRAPASPQPADDRAATSESTSLRVAVLANDTDDGLPAALSIAGLTQPLAGSTAIEGDEIRYTPTAGFLGTDTFSYSVTDGATTATAQVTVDVVAPAGDLWLPFNESAGTTLHDVRGRVMGEWVDGTATASWTTGPEGHGSALAFNGTDEQVRIDLANYNPPSGTTPRTVSCWIQVPPGTGRQSLVTWGQTDTGQKWHFVNEPSGVLRVEVSGGSIIGLTNVQDGAWHHVAAVLPDDGSPDVSEVRLYVDGVEETPIPAGNITARAINTLHALGVFVGSAGGGDFFTGKMDEVRIRNRALTPGEIAAEAALTRQVAVAWHERHYADAAIDWNANTDGDAQKRFAEYALGGIPHVIDPGSAFPVGGIDPTSGRLEFRFQRRTLAGSDLIYTVESSTDLLNWNAVPATLISATPSRPGWEDVHYRSTTGTDTVSRLYLRLRIVPRG